MGEGVSVNRSGKKRVGKRDSLKGGGVNRGKHGMTLL